MWGRIWIPRGTPAGWGPYHFGQEPGGEPRGKGAKFGLSGSEVLGPLHARVVAMLKLDKILLPIDFSGRSCVAARDAGKLARHFHSEVTLLYVNEILVIHPTNGPLGFGVSSAHLTQAGNISRRQQELYAFGTAELTGV